MYIATYDYNNNCLPIPSLEGLRAEETEMRLSFTNGNLHLYNPKCGTWIPVNDLHPDKKVYLYHALATNVSNQLKDVVTSVKRHLNLSGCSQVFKFLSGITLKPQELVTGDEKRIYTSAIKSVKDELTKLDQLHDDLEKYYEKLTSTPSHPSESELE